MQKKAKIAVLVSGGGTNLGALIKAQSDGIIKSGEIKLVVSNNPNAFALKRAENAKIDSVCIEKNKCADQYDFEEKIKKELDLRGIDLIVLAGFMTIISESVSRAFENKIVNVHPALIPSFCGKGYYGLHVHEEALKKGVKLSGATVHFVTEVCDGGPIILQKAVEVKDDDTPETLQRRIMEEAEWKILPEAVSLICQGKVKVIDGKTKIER